MKILLLSGQSGAGKTRIGLELSKDNAFNFIRSFTDRPHRMSDYKDDHYFVTKKMMDFLLTYQLVAVTNIDGCRYCTTFSQFDDKKINIYVVDKKGINDVNRHFPDAQIVSVLLLRDNINIHQSRKNRNILIPTAQDVDIVIKNNTTIAAAVNNLKQELCLYFGDDICMN